MDFQAFPQIDYSFGFLHPIDDSYRALTRSSFTPSHTSEPPDHCMYVCPQLCTPRGLHAPVFFQHALRGAFVRPMMMQWCPKTHSASYSPLTLLSRLDAAGGSVAGPVGPDESLPVRFSTRVRTFFLSFLFSCLSFPIRAI